MVTFELGKGISYFYPNGLNTNDLAILHYAVGTYGFLLNQSGTRQKQITWSAFATLIRQNYSATQRTQAVLTVIEKI